MAVYFVRHTAVAARNICYGQKEMPLADNFETEARQIQASLPVLETFSLVSSTSERTRQLADFLSADYTTDERLKEISFGEWEGVAWHDLDQQQVKEWGNDWMNITPPGAEPFSDFTERVIEFVESRLTDKSIVITHAGVIRVALSHLWRRPLHKMFEIKVPYSAVFQVDL